jgi:DNA oxidative demethylase
LPRQHIHQQKGEGMALLPMTSDHETVGLPAGIRFYPACLDNAGQKRLLDSIQVITNLAPPFVPRMPKSGAPFSVRMTNCGSLGWVSDKERGYRYQGSHLETGELWPPIPDQLMDLWREYAECPDLPEACLINFYGDGAKMGSHRDSDEQEPRAPVLSVSLGDDAVFHVGGPKRTDPKVRIILKSGSMVLLGGLSRFAYHGIDRVLAGTSNLVPGGGRINLTMRRVSPF